MIFSYSINRFLVESKNKHCDIKMTLNLMCTNQSRQFLLQTYEIRSNLVNKTGCKVTYVFAVLGELHHREHQTRPQNVFSVGLHPSANIWDHKTGSKSESENNAVMIINNPMRKPYFDHRGSSQTRGQTSGL